MGHASEKSVLISGASSGIGLACAVELGRIGFQVYAGFRKLEDAGKIKQLVGNGVIPVPLDVTDAQSIQDTVARIQDEGRRLYGLVNNAGVVVAGPMELVSLADLRHQFEVNVIGQVALTQACLPMLRVARGRIVNMGSISGLTTTPFIGPYAASKHALEAVTDALRLELKPWGIHVAVIEPGSIQTPIWERSRIFAEERIASWPQWATALYGKAMEQVARATERSASRASPVDLVSQVVIHALTAKRPKSRYLIGRSAKIRSIMRWLPDPVQDRMVLQYMGLDKLPEA